MGSINILASCLLAALTASIIGNILVLSALLNRKYRFVTIDFLSAVTVSGILSAIFMISPVVVSMIGGKWLFGNTGCVIQAIFSSATKSSTNVYMLCLAIERYLVSRHYGRWKNVDAFRIIIFAVFLIACSFSSFPLIAKNPFYFSEEAYHCQIRANLLYAGFAFMPQTILSFAILLLSVLSLFPVSGTKLSYTETRTIRSLAFFNISLSGLGIASQSLQYMAERFLGETSRVSLLKLALSVSSMACLLQPYLLLSLSPVLRKNIGKSLNLHNHSEAFYINNRYPKLLPREQAPGVISVPQFLDKDRHKGKRKSKCKGKPSTSRLSVEVSRCQLTKNSEFDSKENLYERGHHYTDSRGRQITVFPPEWLSINGSDLQYNETTNNRTKSICFLIQQYQSNKYDFKRRKTLAEIPTSYTNDVGRSEV